MRLPLTEALDWARSAEYERWCYDHGLRPDDVLAISFGAKPPPDISQGSTKDYARVYAYERDAWGQRRIVGSRGEMRLKHAAPQFVAMHWWPEATRAYRER